MGKIEHIGIQEFENIEMVQYITSINDVTLIRQNKLGVDNRGEKGATEMGPTEKEMEWEKLQLDNVNHIIYAPPIRRSLDRNLEKGLAYMEDQMLIFGVI
ncbi:12750_t:CDS:2 [Acaulospora colombiana]|uniref:12750_t:CDS:1 n=1 Tax=Acaulospora colombiana TaxID=27376 RepID=A0ACA9K6E6_9GLOM|nr:12750_t:CDS:2 [Acaulospora colombiana]